MSDQKLKNQLVRIAYANPELRPVVLSLLKPERSEKQAAAVPYGDAERLFDEARQMTIDFTSYMRRLKATADALGDLVQLAEQGRFDRSENITVSNMKYDGETLTANTKSEGGSQTYTTRISLFPKRGYNCTCQDRERTRGSKGPCKHVLALGRAFWTEKLEPELEEIDGALGNVMNKLQLLPLK